ncbi:MAG: PrsW family glutamic-type intramembrane protease [Proteobacteria bacterium]|nr:PrsW family glutamic-type intramembrane protease [Pseudomonadota bacterium]MDA1063956.1 PrsW family glutamic-type intramembrane protease [Pseudomonadota bacterium]
MHSSFLLAPVFLPIIFWAVYHYHKDRHLPEPLAHLLLAFGIGIVAAALSQSLYVALEWVGLRQDAGFLADTSTVRLFAYALLVIGPIEEFSKLILFVLLIVRFKKFDETLDGIIYASFLALGYAAVENWQYLDYLTPLEAGARGFASPVMHMVFASIWGHWIATAHIAGRALLPAALISFVIAAILHGLYDFAVLVQPFSALPCAALLIIAMWIWRLRLMRTLHETATAASAGSDSRRNSGS